MDNMAPERSRMSDFGNKDSGDLERVLKTMPTKFERNREREKGLNTGHNKTA